MPHIANRVILRAWRQRPEADRIHYVAENADGSERRLTVDKGDPLHTILDSHLQSQGYTGPHGQPVPDDD